MNRTYRPTFGSLIALSITLGLAGTATAAGVTPISGTITAKNAK